MIIVKPETIIRWHRKRFYEYLIRKKKKDAGRPRVSREIIELIKRIANENPMWGVPRIHGEILKLDYDISQATVWRYTPKDKNNTTGQRWKTFLKNHAAGIISIDFFCVLTINFKLLHVLVFLSHGRRKIIHFNITANPTSEWAHNNLRMSFMKMKFQISIMYICYYHQILIALLINLSCIIEMDLITEHLLFLF